MTHDAGDEEFGDADAQAERAAKRQRHAEAATATAGADGDAETVLTTTGADDEASSAPERAAALQPMKPQQQPYTRITALPCGCVNAALRPPNWRRHAGWLSEELPGPLLYRHVKPEWYRRPSSLPVIPGGMLR